MKRRSFFLAVPGLAGCWPAKKRRLNVLNWSDYVAPETLPDFEHEFGVYVRYGTFESAEEMLARVMSGNSGWDVVFPPNYYIHPMVLMGLLAPLDHSRLTHLDALQKEFQAPPWDKGLRWSVPYMYGATGILFQAGLEPRPQAWADLWRESWRGRMTMLDDPAEVLGACLKKLGYSLNSGDENQLLAAKAEALRQKPLLRAYANETIRDQLVAGELLAAQVWRSTAMRAMQAAPGKLNFAYPQEGFPLYCDTVAILRESKRQELAHAFLNYLLRPQVARRIGETKLESTVNAEARKLLPATLREDPVLYPPAEVLERGEWFEPLPARVQQIRDRIWTEIKSA
ncbi:MAG: spermidine/putrescine ABC transporter substrate-binding protein [Bryobacteraceae bacterium]|nr:spermidine/putrescine ABC transporter substrate-binding protein [Bryobacteraceae bacterium]MDW8377325.1 spermidine/putrescine ABC transporter substrate-binding protein [Bryobacterales bacterium]